MEKFKSLEEAQKAFEEKGFGFEVYKSGANKGTIKGSLSSLTKMYSEALKLIGEEPTPKKEAVKKKVKKAVEKKEEEKPQEVVFHRGKPKKFNSFLFRKQ